MSIKEEKDININELGAEIIEKLKDIEQYQHYKKQIDNIKNNLSTNYNISTEETEKLIDKIRELKLLEYEFLFKKVPDIEVNKLITMIEKNAETEYETMIDIVLPYVKNTID